MFMARALNTPSLPDESSLRTHIGIREDLLHAQTRKLTGLQRAQHPFPVPTTGNRAQEQPLNPAAFSNMKTFRSETPSLKAKKMLFQSTRRGGRATTSEQWKTLSTRTVGVQQNKVTTNGHLEQSLHNRGELAVTKTRGNEGHTNHAAGGHSSGKPQD